jgi:hypothetical protein
LDKSELAEDLGGGEGIAGFILKVAAFGEVRVIGGLRICLMHLSKIVVLSGNRLRAAFPYVAIRFRGGLDSLTAVMTND